MPQGCGKRSRWGVLGPFWRNGCDVAQLLDPRLDEHLRTEGNFSRRAGDAEKERRVKKKKERTMKKQFNRMKQLANQTVGRWVVVPAARGGVQSHFNIQEVCCYTVWFGHSSFIVTSRKGWATFLRKGLPEFYQVLGSLCSACLQHNFPVDHWSW